MWVNPKYGASLPAPEPRQAPQETGHRSPGAIHRPKASWRGRTPRARTSTSSEAGPGAKPPECRPLACGQARTRGHAPETLKL